MFTQCPDCDTTFRVSTKVLEQAQGRVRCGGCGNAFNALDYLSEDDAATNVEPEERGPASGISSVDQNRELLETLDKLAGPEVRIEDTGVEWRVMDDELPETESESGATSSLRFVLEGSFDDDEAEPPPLHGRQGDVQPDVSDVQESLDLDETEPVSPSAKPGERRYDDNTILPDDFGQDDALDELPFFVKPESPKRRASDREAARDTAAFDEAQADLALGEPDEWVELLDEVGDAEHQPARDDESPAQADSATATPDDEKQAPADVAATGEDLPVQAVGEPPEEDMPSDIDMQFLQQAEEMGLDTGSHRIAAIGDAAGDSDETIDEVEEAPAEQTETDVLEDTDIREAMSEDGDEALTLEAEDADAKLESTGEFEAKIAVAEKALADEDEDHRKDDADEAKGPVELALDEEPADSSAADDEDAVPARDKIAAAMLGGKDISHFFDEDSPMVETIVMEGEGVHDALQQERRRPVELLRDFENPGSLQDTYSLNREKIRGGRRSSDPPSYTVIASVVGLVLVLLGQIIHQSRQTLATYGAFNQTIGSIYRALGEPVTPDWDIRGWRFEATNGSVDESEKLLTIYSRVANKSGKPLPYPLVHISLTDRWEEIIGSRVLEPKDYLAGDLDPRKPVPSGEHFTAVITVDSPSIDATGFKLNVCYRVAPGRVRCAIEDFKN